MAGIATSSTPGTVATLSARQHFSAIAWLRWRIFVNSLRSKGAKGELVARIASYPLLALMVLGPSVGAAVGSFYLVHQGEVALLAIPFWIIFGLWQFIGMNTSATGPSFDLSSLIRFPIRYRDYLLIRLSFGLMDPPTLAGIACLIASCIGIGIAAPALLPWSLLTLAIYAVCNILFSRMVYSWLERWLAQRRTRELVTGIILAGSLGFQFLAQYAQRLSHVGNQAQLNPWLLKTVRAIVAANWLLPPGLAATSIDRFHSGALLIAVGALGGLLLFTAGFLLILHLRLRAEFRGENLSEAPSAAKSKAVRNTRVSAAPDASSSISFLPAAVAANLVKEVRYLQRSGPRLYVLIMPVFVVFLISMRTSGLSYAGLARHGIRGMLFSYGCAYMQFIFVSLIYNSLGAEGAGVQFYFIAPLRMRDVMLAKNLLTLAIFAVEAVLIYGTSAVIAGPTPIGLTAATVAWSLFTLFASMAIGNVRSITSPKATDFTRMRSQNVGGLNSLISLIVVVIAILLGVLMMAVCRYLHVGYWPAVAVFLVLAGLSFGAYLLVLKRLDDIAGENQESLTRELAKA